jgi:hypothetical protein
VLPLLTVAVLKGLGQRQIDTYHPTPRITQYVPIDPGLPPPEQYAPAVPVRVVSRSLPCVYAVFLTAPLTVGGAQQLPHRR